jgi:hypothetical protein
LDLEPVVVVVVVVVAAAVVVVPVPVVVRPQRYGWVGAAGGILEDICRLDPRRQGHHHEDIYVRVVMSIKKDPRNGSQFHMSRHSLVATSLTACIYFPDRTTLALVGNRTN